MTYYEHQQTSYMMIWLPAVAAVVIAIGANLESSPGREILLVVSIVFLITIPLFYKLEIVIENESLRWRFGAGIIRKSVPIAQIVGCDPIRIRWWYGWGIHLTPYGWLYNVAGWEAVAITLRDGRKLALGTDDSHGLVEAIRGLLDKGG